MYIVKHTFEDKYTGLPVVAGTIVELEEGERKKYLLENGLVAVAEVIRLTERHANENESEQADAADEEQADAVDEEKAKKAGTRKKN